MGIVRIQNKYIRKIDMIVTTGMTGKQVYAKYKPDALINLGLYNMATSENIVYAEDENKQSGYLFANEGIGILGQNKIVWTTINKAYNDSLIRDYISGAPILVKDNKIQIIWGNKISTQIQGKHNRTAIGFNDKELILYTSDDNITLDTLALRMKQNGCKYAINCDGGGSSYLQNAGNMLKYSYRKNVSWLLVYFNTKEEFTVFKYANTGKSQPVYETTECKKKIGSLDPFEICDCLYEFPGYKVVLYNITGTAIKKVGFIKS